jgi:hypothetical protein
MQADIRILEHATNFSVTERQRGDRSIQRSEGMSGNARREALKQKSRMFGVDTKDLAWALSRAKSQKHQLPTPSVRLCGTMKLLSRSQEQTYTLTPARHRLSGLKIAQKLREPTKHTSLTSLNEEGH